MPLVQITSPATAAMVTYLTDILGTVTDPNLDSWQLAYARLGKRKRGQREGKGDIVDYF